MKHSNRMLDILGERYVIYEEKMGAGARSVVMKGLDLSRNRNVAVKIAEKSPKDVGNLNRELKALQAVRELEDSEARYVQLLDVYQRKTQTVMVFETIQGCELMQFVQRHPFGVPEPQAKNIARQVTKSLNDMHQIGWAHLDVKLENIMMEPESLQTRLIDFGFAMPTRIGKKSLPVMEFHGSIHYVAPEVIRKTPFDGEKADVWSLGVTLYAMLCNRFPFDHSSHDIMKIFEQILSGLYKPAAHLSLEAQHLISHMLDLDANRRYTMEQVLNHPWMRERRAQVPQLVSVQEEVAIMDTSSSDDSESSADSAAESEETSSSPSSARSKQSGLNRSRSGSSASPRVSCRPHSLAPPRGTMCSV